tara:strand:- start:78 stop:587 length:510 start_codon:yes stop_codon:yes gene_type:complete
MPDGINDLTLPPITPDLSDIQPIGLKPLGPPVNLKELQDLAIGKPPSELVRSEDFMPDPQDMWRLRKLKELEMQQQGFPGGGHIPLPPGVPEGFHPGEAPGVWNAPGIGPPTLPGRPTRPFAPGGRGDFLPLPLNPAPSPQLNPQANLMGVPTGGPSNLGNLSQMSGMA